MSGLDPAFLAECVAIAQNHEEEKKTPETIFAEITAGHESMSPIEQEAKFYYYGLHSRPILVARTSTHPWVMPTGPDDGKELGIASSHEINAIWDDSLGRKVVAYLDERGVKWTSIDIVRIGISGEYRNPVILWIGVFPDSLPREEGRTVAFGCLDILHKAGIDDIDVEIRESIVRRLVDEDEIEPAHKGKSGRKGGRQVGKRNT